MIKHLFFALILTSCVSYQSVRMSDRSSVKPGGYIRVELKNGEKIRLFKVLRIDSISIVGKISIVNINEHPKWILKEIKIQQISRIDEVHIERKKQETVILTTVGLLVVGLIVSIFVGLNSLNFPTINPFPI